VRTEMKSEFFVKIVCGFYNFGRVCDTIKIINEKQRSIMLIDITLKITEQMIKDAMALERKELAGHLGTHFDVMNKEFPIEYTRREGVAFDVSMVKDRDISVEDIDADKINAGMFVMFYTGFIENVGYGEKTYFTEHPQLSKELINILLDKGVSLIGLDFAGIRRGKEHIPTDQDCADRGTFVIENLCNLKSLAENKSLFTVNTYPLYCTHLTGLPCRVIAEI